jgi:hypothetical protein
MQFFIQLHCLAHTLHNQSFIHHISSQSILHIPSLPLFIPYSSILPYSFLFLIPSPISQPSLPLPLDHDSEQYCNKHLKSPRLPLFVTLANGESVGKSSPDQNTVRFNDSPLLKGNPTC